MLNIAIIHAAAVAFAFAFAAGAIVALIRNVTA